MLSGAQDDIEFRYYFALYPNTGSDAVTHPRLAVGNYVLMRQEPNWVSRTSGVKQGFTPIDWNSLRYSPNHGRVVACGSGNQWPDCPEYRDLTYMVLQINYRVCVRRVGCRSEIPGVSDRDGSGA